MTETNYLRVNFRYDYLERFSTYWHQLYEALRHEPRTVLEVGPGTYQFHDYLRRRGVSVATLDIVPPQESGVVGTVTDLPFRDGSFDVAVAYEVLEHIPFEDFSSGLAELWRVTRQRVVISVPDNRYYVRFLANAISRPGPKHYGRELRFMVSFPRLFHRKLPPHEAKLGAQHLWEIGRHGYPLRKVLRQIPANMRPVRHYRLWHNPFHHMFVFEKSLDKRTP